MKLATIENGTRDGKLILVSEDGRKGFSTVSIPQTLQQALDNWESFESVFQELCDPNSQADGEWFELNDIEFRAPLPRAYQWLDGSGYVHHIELVRRARGVDLPPNAFTDPIMYQGASDDMLGPQENIANMNPDWGVDFEAEIAVIVGDVPLGATKEEAIKSIRLVTLINDWSLRGLIPAELTKGFGFLQGKPAVSFAPFAVSPNQLTGWKNGVLNANIKVDVNGKNFGDLNPSVDIDFDFGDLIAHAAKTRRLEAGTIIGGGTVANRDIGTGHGCIAEIRAVETIEHGAPITPFLDIGDVVEIEAYNINGSSIFGSICSKVS